ncbi:phosphonate ABC transporter ATP-binding protein [Paenibacillus sp. MWE-103]|uniref:Phosphonate ABC transporter ATP-binding protein n=1 Tax=Paenibacillus artemisiicola TaxID=1172618 RepID=A0ABS3WC33_9BACL|nr:phosphonate ABC transporter ATP-binding protein [Paenibacillus artemisiicola]MBO7745877.1 phosphonate ABC transporter ATP-binding protein [Paenibacillus artemisiicola]
MASLLEIHGLSKVYADGTAALKDVSFSVRRGEFVAVIGPSGAGKSTLLRCINRLVKPSGGEIRFQEIDAAGASGRQVRQLRRQTGMIFQHYNLIQRVSVLRNVLHGRLGYMNAFSGSLGLFSRKDVEEAKRILHRLGLSQQMYKRADELSGGQQQRVGIARALSQKPELILADEPIASLDPVTSRAIMEHLSDICRADGITCIVNLHQVAMARDYATRIIGIHKGEVVFDGPPGELSEDVIHRIYGAAPDGREQGGEALAGA